MAGAEQTSLQVDFNDSAFSLDGAIVMERSNREPEGDKEVFFRVHGGSEHSIRSTSGSVSRAQTGLKRFTSEFVIFSGTTTQSIKYPGAESVRLERKGSVYDDNGNQLQSPGFLFDAAKNLIVSTSGIVHAVVLIEYKAPYDLWRAKFGGVCPSVQTGGIPLDLSRGSPDDDIAYDGLDPMLITAWKAGVMGASLQLEPPACVSEDEESSLGRRLMDARKDSIRIEVDPEKPIRLIPRGFGSNLPLAGCTLRFYPGRAGIGINSIASTNTSSGKLTVDMNAVEERKVRDVMTFSGRSSATLDYLPSSTRFVNLSVRTIPQQFTDQWGRKFTPKVFTAGDTITAVDWINQNTYRNPVSRTLPAGEIAIGDLFGNAIPCYGSLEVTYTTSFFTGEFEFEYDQGAQRFKEASVIAASFDEAFSIALAPPSTDGFF